ncbi:MAG: hypothetical protein FWG20_04925 [Candidatus Cloacimonetes bacterium]|nr:hypothetical protein [Candidatus Cloacimonadota bacterium]
MKTSNLIVISMLFILLLSIGCSDSKTTATAPSTAMVTISLDTIGEGSIIGTAVTLSLKGSEDYVVTKTLADSTILFEDVPFGEYIVTATLSDCVTYVYENLSVFEIAITHHVTMLPLATVRVIHNLINLQQPALVGAQVTLTHTQNPNYEFSMVVEGDTGALFTEIPFGEYNVYISRPNYQDFFHHNVKIIQREVTLLVNL